MIRRSFWVVVLLVQLAGADALAQRGAKIFGTWRSSSGNTFLVHEVAGRGFGLVWIQPNGTRSTLRGQWVRGMRGTQFEYFGTDGQRITGTFGSEDPDRIRVADATRVNWWQRQVNVTPAASAHGIFGAWSSSSGNVFQIQNAPGRGFALYLTRPDGVRQVMRGKWVQGMRGTQFQYWDGAFSYTGTFSSTDSNRIRLTASDGSVSWWQRQMGPAWPGRRRHHGPHAGDEIDGTTPHVLHLRQAQRVMQAGMVALGGAPQACRNAMNHNMLHSVQTLQALQLGATHKSISDHGLFVAGMVLAGALAKCPEAVNGPLRQANMLVQSAKNSYR